MTVCSWRQHSVAKVLNTRTELTSLKPCLKKLGIIVYDPRAGGEEKQAAPWIFLIDLPVNLVYSELQ